MCEKISKIPLAKIGFREKSKYSFIQKIIFITLDSRKSEIEKKTPEISLLTVEPRNSSFVFLRSNVLFFNPSLKRSGDKEALRGL